MPTGLRKSEPQDQERSKAAGAAVWSSPSPGALLSLLSPSGIHLWRFCSKKMLSSFVSENVFVPVFELSVYIGSKVLFFGT
jgi:hypothetical protein